MRKDSENTGGCRRSVDQKRGVLKCVFSRMLKNLSGSLLAVLFRIKAEIRQGMVILVNILKETSSVESAGIFAIPDMRDLTLSLSLPVN